VVNAGSRLTRVSKKNILNREGPGDTKVGETGAGQPRHQGGLFERVVGIRGGVIRKSSGTRVWGHERELVVRLEGGGKKQR